MLTTTARTFLIGVSATALLMGSTAFAQLTPVQSGDITYVTGGIGRDEVDALKATQGAYNLHVMSSSISGHFVGDTNLTLIDHKGTPVLTADAGPIFYAKLPAGTYTVEAAHEGIVKKQRVTVGTRSARVNFAWPEAAEDTVTIRGESSTPLIIPPLGATNQRVVGTVVTEPPAMPPAETPPAPVYQAAPAY